MQKLIFYFVLTVFLGIVFVYLGSNLSTKKSIEQVDGADRAPVNFAESIQAPLGEANLIKEQEEKRLQEMTDLLDEQLK